MLVVGEELDLCDSACVLLQVGDEFTRADFPNANFTLHAARADEFAALRQANRGDASLVGVVDLPQKRAIVYSIGPNFAVGPSTQDDFIGENCAERVNSSLSGCVLRGRSDASCGHCVRVGVPKSHRSIFAAGDEFI